MIVEGDYRRDGHALVRGLIGGEICNAFLRQFQIAIEANGATVAQLNRSSTLLSRDAPEVYGYHYPPMLALLWGLTPAIAGIVGRDLMPSYSYMRLYREGDICRVHGDRPACEHSLSLTLDYSDGVEWPLELGTRWMEKPTASIESDFGEEPSVALTMAAGDAVLYRGVALRHGRTIPNPNQWSAHLFLHWVERDGSYAEHAFDGNRELIRPVHFQMP